MNQDIKRRWVEALRSGQYKQGRHRLCNAGVPDNSFCCLGVLTDLYAKDHGEEWKRSRDLNYFTLNGEAGTLSPSVVEWAGLDDCCPRTEFESLAILNDRGMPFTEIADLIEQHL